MVQDNPILQSNDNFEFCKARCRTSSESVLFDKEYRSEHKYCYGTRAPHKDADFDMDRAKYEALYANIETNQHVKKAASVKKAADEILLDNVIEKEVAFLDVDYESNHLDLLPINADLNAEGQLFGMLGGHAFVDQDTSAGPLLSHGHFYFLFPLVFTLFLSFRILLVSYPVPKKKCK
eukprot:CAMPEP_0117032464 /NCGR_PEP_ID=MMETSP0472-20121206/23267_1 /TAXON_ID=693140 ORGANISM="Tiarina fusus, Strain LIS" /NCGR_SAMPLE_ID=MMETSP0472 /ASSEMBLY_ACC=CAM_ASM_000603 /LENGTH=177 /DNA_ID=CAMNT_0004741105 /DNA_START=399 /DNA_END=929 /DNA_ORIENTATION=+